MITDVPILKGEVVVREYECLKMKPKPKTRKSLNEPNSIKDSKSVTAKLMVTNKRIMYISQRDAMITRGTSHFHQMNICDAGDIDMLDTRWRSYTALILSIILGILLLAFSPILSLIVIIAGALWTFLRMRSVVYVSIGSKGSDGGVFAGNIGTTHRGTLCFPVKPGADFDLMSRELGTLVLDIQQNGDSCLYKWLQNGNVGEDDEQA